MLAAASLTDVLVSAHVYMTVLRPCMFVCVLRMAVAQVDMQERYTVDNMRFNCRNCGERGCAFTVRPVCALCGYVHVLQDKATTRIRCYLHGRAHACFML